ECGNGAALLSALTRISPADNAPSLRRFSDVTDDDSRVFKVRSDFELAAKRLDVPAQVAHMHVATPFQLCHSRLADRERACHILLREGPRLAQLLESHRLAQYGRLCGHARPAGRREALGQFAEGPVSGHGINPSCLISLM